MDIKGFLKLDSIYGAKLVRILYYALLIADAGSFFHGVISGIVTMAQGAVAAGLWRFITAPFLFVLLLIVIRVVCEALTVYFAKHEG